MNDLTIIKASGERVKFDESKLIASLDRSGAGADMISKVLEGLQEHLSDGMTSRKIYRQAHRLLNKISTHNAGRYKLKEAIFELGPSGYPFEHFFGELLRNQGYQTQVGVIIEGKCVSHEIDVVAENEHNHFMVECKFHSSPGKKSNVIVPMYIHSRFKDIIATMENLPGYATKLHQSWVVTNTRFTQDAIDYGKCMGMNLVSWDYPHETNLRNRIDRSGLHPITTISTLKKSEKQHLLGLGIVTCRNLLERKDQLVEMGIGNAKIKRVMLDAERIIHKQ
jgi:hypothetical protein